MRLRSLLFVPGDRPERMAKARNLGADALILDLEDAVSPANKAAARDAVAAFLTEPCDGVARLVRINPLEGPHIADDLASLASARLDGIVVPKAEGAASIRHLVERLEPIGLAGTPIMPIATETPAAMFQLGSYASVADRLLGITWGAEDLPAAIGADTAREADGRYTPPFELARSLTLFAAAAAAVAPIETVYPDFRDLDGLAAYAARAARDGFTGMMAIHPAQLSTINAAFSPTAEAIARAREIVEAFGEKPNAGVLQVDGRMVDAPHLKHARRILERAGESDRAESHGTPA